MHPSVWAVVICMTLMIALSTLGERYRFLKTLYFIGIEAWSTWVPLVALFLLSFLLLNNLPARPWLSELSLRTAFSRFELLLILATLPLFFTNFGNLVAVGILAFFSMKVFAGKIPFASNSGTLFFLSSLSILMVLSDRLPGHRGPQFIAIRVRESLSFLLAFGSLFTILIAVLQLRAFQGWLWTTFSIGLSQEALLAFLGAATLVWITISLGITRHFSLPMIALPSLYPAAYVTGWPPEYLMVPFLAALALTLAIGDRRQIRRWI